MRFHEPGVPVLLMSLKCGVTPNLTRILTQPNPTRTRTRTRTRARCGVGLNLTCASTVVMCEPWWNPFAEDQACDRVHRIGQQKVRRPRNLNIPSLTTTTTPHPDLRPTPKPDANPAPKAVRVLRLAVADTVEDRIMPLEP